MRQRSQGFKEVANFGAGPVLRADELAADEAFAIDDVGFGPHFGFEELGGVLVRVADGDEVDVVANEEVAVLVGIFIDADGKNGDAGQVVMELEEGGQFNDAGLAPGGPEVEQHHLAAIAGKVNGGGAVGDGEVGGELAGLGGVSAAVAGGDKPQRQEEQESE